MKTLLLISLLSFGCVQDKGTRLQELNEDKFPDLDKAEATKLADLEFGVGLRSGEGMAMAFLGKNLDDISKVAPEAFLNLQSFDHAAQTFGDFQVYPVPASVPARGAGDFIGEKTSNAFLGARATDFYAEMNDAEAEAGASFKTRSVVLDLYRDAGDWYMRWDGSLDGNKTGKGAYGMYREDMVEDLLNEIESIATNQKPKYFIIGDGMERFLGTEGLAPGEFSNFLAFYKSAVARIKKGNSATKVGCGINYDNFLKTVVPAFHSKQETTNELLADAIEAVILPCAEIGDVVALRSYRSPEEETLSFPTGELSVLESYQFLRRLQGLYTLEKPILWYSVASPLQGPVNYLQQKLFLESFLKWIAGTKTSTIVWRYALNLDGADTGNQKPTGRCKALTESSRDFQRPIADCYDGLLTSVFSEKDTLKYINSVLP